MTRFGIVALVLAGVGCRGGSTEAPPVVASATAADARAPMPVLTGMPVLRIVLDDPRLAHARELDAAKDWLGAARAVHDARTDELSGRDRCRWDYVEGRLWLQGGSGAEAAAAFARADEATCTLAVWARVHGAQAAARAGLADDALLRARAVPSELEAAKDDVRLVIAESLSAKGDRAGALPLWRDWLAANPHGSRWVDTSLRIANALLDGVAGPPEDGAREALDLATKVMVEAPKLADAIGAPAARARAIAVLRGRDPSVSDLLADDLRARQAQAWLDAGEPARAFELSSAILSSARTGSAACRAAITRANAAAKARGNHTDGWPDAVNACEKDEQLVDALYFGAKSHSSKDPKLAVDWFGRVEHLFPAHRFADDARFRAALIVAQSTEEGHEQRAEQMLRTLPDAYPQGDMRTEALFRVALDAMKRGQWSAAAPLLDRISELAPDDRHWAIAGRAEYFRARAAAAAGDAEAARTAYARIIAKYPLAYYMLLAYGRLAAADAALAKKALTDAEQRDSTGSFPSGTLAFAHSPAFGRFVELLEVGDIDAARREVAVVGAVADGADPEQVWLIGGLYNQAGAPELGHAFARGRLTDFGAHYPVGRWRVPWTVGYPRAFEPLVLRACAANGLSTSLAWAIMREESSFVADARSRSNALGLMQLMGPTAKWVAAGTPWQTDEAALKRPEVSIDLGVRLLSKLRSAHTVLPLAIGAYNAGSGAIGKWTNGALSDDLDLFVELVPYDETRNYIKRVLSTEATYAYLYDPGALDELLRLPPRLTR